MGFCIFYGVDVEQEHKKCIEKEVKKLVERRVKEGSNYFVSVPRKGFCIDALYSTIQCTGASVVIKEYYIGCIDVSDTCLDTMRELGCSVHIHKDVLNNYEMRQFFMSKDKAKNFLDGADLLVIYCKNEKSLRSDADVRKRWKKDSDVIWKEFLDGRITRDTVNEKVAGMRGGYTAKIESDLYFMCEAAKNMGIPILNLYTVASKQYKKSEYIGVRKRKTCSTWLYRIKKVLPTGEKVTLERGGYMTALEAYKAREKKIKELTYVYVKDDRKFSEVFEEFLHTIKAKETRKKYESIYKIHIKTYFENIRMCDVTDDKIDDFIYSVDGYKTNKRGVYTSEKVYSRAYIQSIKEVVNRVYKYAREK